MKGEVEMDMDIEEETWYVQAKKERVSCKEEWKKERKRKQGERAT